MKSKLIKLVIGILFIVLILYLYPIGKLVFSNVEVTKALLWDEYYVKVTSDKYELDILKDYMESKGWIENESKRLGGLHIFERNGEEKGILNTAIKTIVVDGKLNVVSFIFRFLN
ncbi:MAG: hypothetical protein K0Q97_2645 [Bacillota bacterium]|jgi:hypothetical protein|nr:hypothetical protein [Bacillota bacterium]